MKKVLVLAAALACAMPPAARAQEWSASRVDSHAPLGVMGDHTHEAGEWMLSFRYMRMDMDGNRNDRRRVSASDVLGRYPVTPLEMSMGMYMAGVMYAPTGNVTLMGMVPVLGVSMDHRTRTGVGFTTESGGIGDVSVSALVQVFDADRQRVHLNLGVSAPSGSIQERGDTPAAADVRLPYPMQLGSGTWDARPGLTYLGQLDDWSWGAQGIATLRMGENDNAYTLGNRFSSTAWLARVLADYASVSLRLGLDTWGDVSGADPALNPMMVPTADPSLRGGTRADVGVGFNLEGRSGALSGQRLAIEVLVPMVQDLHGPQLETDWTIVVGWQKAFAP